jgi:phage tail-like protein
MRGSVPGLLSPYPLGAMLPAYLQEDQFAVRWVRGFDDALAPVISVLDCIDAYVDPFLAPDDFPPWLASWVGAMQDENWPDDRQRRAIASAVTLHGGRGTMAGLRAQLELATGGRVDITGGGAVTWSTTPDDSFPPQVPAALHVRVTVADPSTVNVPTLDALVDGLKPAHLPHTIEVASE